MMNLRKGLEGPEVEKRPQAFCNRERPEILAWETRAAARSRAARLERLSERAAEMIEPTKTLTIEMITRDFQVHKPDLLSNISGDLIFPKINHGFWEQYLSILYDGYVASVMRPTARQHFTDSYLTSRFSDALLNVSRALASVDNNRLNFPGLHFGFSFNSGDVWHDNWLRRQTPESLSKDLVPKGVYAGAHLFFSDIADGASIVLADGAYPKRGLLDGELNELFQQIGQDADHIVFCVPPHLAGIRLKAVPHAVQENIFVSARLVHHAWPITLAATTRGILQRLALGEQVAVITQSAVFSGLMGLYLAHAKRTLKLPGRLRYVDLGQALDAARLDSPGLWASIKMKSGALTEDTDIPFEIG